MAVEITPAPQASLFVGKGVAPSTQKVRLVHVATGAVHEAWPIDAREHLKAGDYVPEAEGVVNAPAADPPPPDVPKPKSKLKPNVAS